MAHVDGRAYCALARIEIGPDCIEGGVFHDHDHDGSSEHRRKDRVLEPVRKMLGLDEEAEGAFGSRGYLSHDLASKAATSNMRATVLSSLGLLLPGASQMIHERLQPLSS
jgi:hypothetical protein